MMRRENNVSNEISLNESVFHENSFCFEHMGKWCSGIGLDEVNSAEFNVVFEYLSLDY